MANPLRSQSLLGNQNAAGKHIRRFGATVASGASALKNKISPTKPGALKTGLSTAKRWATDPTVPLIGAGIGTYKGIVSNSLAKSMGMATVKHAVKKAALRGAVSAVGSNLPLAVAAGTAYGIAKAVQKRNAEKRSIRGRAKTAVAAVKRVVKTTVKKLKG